MKIETSFWRKPIPYRSMDWEASTSDYEPGDPVGYGATEAEAIKDLLDQLADE